MKKRLRCTGDRFIKEKEILEKYERGDQFTRLDVYIKLVKMIHSLKLRECMNEEPTFGHFGNESILVSQRKTR